MTKHKEYLDTNYELRSIKQTSGDNRVPDGWIEVPEGAEIFLLDKSFGEDTIYFVKHDGEVFHEYYISGTNISHNTWIKGTLKELHNGMGEVLWKRNRTITPNTSIQNKLKPKNGEVKMKEFLNPEQGHSLVKCFVGETPIPEDWLEIPEGAEIAIELAGRPYFMKFNGETFDEFYCSVWQTGTMTKSSVNRCRKILWERNLTTPNTSTQEKLKFIEKWLNGEKIQYILGIETDKTQPDKSKWHNFTDGAMQYIKRSDIKFREAPKYVTINGIEFKSIEKLVKYVKNNFDLEDVE